MNSVCVKMIAVWFLADAVYSIFYHINNPTESWISNIYLRASSGILAITLMTM
jgi:hypothetical protein